MDGEPVARASASFGEHAVSLFGGATLPEARGRGAYRALVAARWEDAVARGTPVLVTQAGRMSQPILAQLGFRAVCEIRILLDRFGSRDSEAVAVDADRRLAGAAEDCMARETAGDPVASPTCRTRVEASHHGS